MDHFDQLVILLIVCKVCTFAGSELIELHTLTRAFVVLVII